MRIHYAIRTLVLTGLFPINYSANVLCVFTDCVQPNLIVFMAVASTLIENGHNVTIVTSIPIPQQVYPRNKFNHIYVQIPIESIRKIKDMHVIMYNESIASMTVFSNFIRASNIFMDMQINVLKNERFQEFFHQDNKFDLLVLGYFYNDFMVGIAARYKCPIAIVSLCAPFGTLNRWIGSPSMTSYVQIPLFGRSQPMIFLDRLQNFVLDALEPFVYMYAQYYMERIYRNLFPDDSYPHYSEMISNISLVLYNRHFSEMPIRPLVPALVEIGGIQVEDQSHSLPQDIKEFLDTSENGTILFRVGSLARSTELKPEQIKIILNVLSKLDQRTIWEWERPDDHPNDFPNILFYPSITPNAILPHRNLRLYITDGRPLAIQEANYHGVPMLGLPQFGEEPYTVAEMTNSGFGVSCDVNNLTEQSFTESLRHVLQKPYYAQKVKRSSQLLRDRPNTARETAAFWLEYVIRHRGALHMQSPLVHMNFIKRWNIDVIVVLIVIVWVFVKLVLIMGLVVRTFFDLRTQRNKAKIKSKQY